MGFDYIGMRDTVAEPLIARFGDVGYFSLPGETIGEDYESDLNNDSECRVAYVRTQFKKSENSGTLVEKNDVMFLVSTEGVNFDPELADRFTADCVEYQIVRIDPLQPGPVVMLWKVHARK